MLSKVIRLLGQQKQFEFMDKPDFVWEERPEIVPGEEDVLFHGTIIDNLKSIKDLGVFPDVGDFVSDAYDRDYEEDQGVEYEELVFAADWEGLETAVTAMVHHVAKKLDKTFHAVTLRDVLEHGLLVAFHYQKEDWEHRETEDEDYYGEFPRQVEPGDWFSRATMVPDDYIYGNTLLMLLYDSGIMDEWWGENATLDSKPVY